MLLTLKILDKNNQVLLENSAEDFVDLVCERIYEEGDKILLELSEKNVYINWQADDALGEAFLYAKENGCCDIPFGEKRASYSPKAFYGARHYLYARTASAEEITRYRNLALNPVDQRGETAVYPHASANVETRGEAVFAAKNAIDGVYANCSHGEWPYQSWGINRQDDACIRIDFGRKVRIDKAVLFTRADFPHDNWWIRGSLRFSDGTVYTFLLEKTAKAQTVIFPEKETEWVELYDLIKAEDPSPFPALTQIEVWGVNVV